MTEREVRALILCGGVGKRLRPLTLTTPKPLLEIREGFTILDKQLSDLKKAGISTVYLLTSYLANQIKKRYGSRWDGVNIFYPEEKEPRGTLWAFKNAIEQINCDVIAQSGDVVSDISFSNLIRESQQSDNLITIVTTKMRSPYGVLEIKDGKILSFKEKPILDFYINASIYYFKKQSFPYFFEDYTEKDVEETVFPKLAKQGLVGSYFEDVFWQSIDSMKNLERVKDKYQDKV